MSSRLQQHIFNNDAVCWATVILPLALPQVYTYAIPSKLKDKVQEGIRVEVNFGANKKYAGVVKELLHEQPPFVTKPILNVLDELPVVFPTQLQFWSWLSAYYLCTEGEVMTAALPAHFKISSETQIVFNEEVDPNDFHMLTDEEFLVAEALHIRTTLQINEIQQILDQTKVYPVIKSLLDKKIAFVWEKLTEKYKPRKENFIRLADTYDEENSLASLLNDWKGAHKQMELLLAYLHLSKTTGEVSQTELLRKSSATTAQLKALVEKGILQTERRTIDRIRQLPPMIQLDFELSAAQQQALASIRHIFSQKNICLLHGVTGSGKTQLYMHQIAEVVQSGLQVLYLLPEISLTSQLIRRIQKHFGGHIAVYHSKFNDQERIELWHKVRDGKVSVILGARSALFLPFSRLGLIVVDEEHDSSFKQQDPAPRYNARDAAIYYASLFNAKVLLGSGTPSLESYFHAQTGKYGLVELMERFGGWQLPKIEVVNVGAEKQKGKVMISSALHQAINEAVASNRQVILFQNRRGYHPYIICGTCGHIPQCQHCDVSLTLHKHSNKLHCHYCGSSYSRMDTCVACGSNNWLEKNFGTEKVEEQLESDFPALRIARMDIDSVRGKTAHDQLIQQFESHRHDILVGTQMVVKGLDFDKVSLVGILDADGLLSFTDFRVNERAFQLMEQVAGRAGRKEGNSQVLVQAINTKHPVIEWVKNHDYVSMYRHELENRKQFNYPPFSRLLRLTLKHRDVDKLQHAAGKLAQLLSVGLNGNILGPAFSVIPRIRNQYHMEIMLKLPRESAATVKKWMKHQITLWQSDQAHRSIQLQLDADPQ